ncbi:hypothetical protein FIBSPDRAFT_876011 [Athelia psychrophila]|uniref:Uncharacterized protein n=1 Tax=Athelia psychrophila TaxID=1759441 RepID=A0A167X9Q2_9AGAM|nr:hypothetical protein FIBSPDRAFT_876011 [Fibularhizoctonia sp. CBS 109695]
MKPGFLSSTSYCASCSSTHKVQKSGCAQRHKAVRTCACKRAIPMLRESGQVGAVATLHDIIKWQRLAKGMY